MLQSDLFDKITTIRCSEITGIAGRVTEEQRHSTERGLVVFSGVA